MVHVREVMGEYEKRGAQVLGLTGQDPEELRKYLTFHEMPFLVLNDVELEVIREYGLEDEVGPPRGVIPRPAEIIIDGEGILRFVYVSEESDDFPSDEALFEVLDMI
jgi:peroxiredoxin